MTQAGPEGAELVVRTKLPPDALASSVMRTLRAINPGQPANEFRPIQQIVDHAVSPRRFFVLLVASFAALGLILATLGIYGVISYSVTRQTQEIGIRMALGARGRQIVWLVVGQNAQWLLIGITTGVASALALTRLLAAYLYAVRPTDATTFIVVALVLAAVACFACYIPARRATKVDPMVALRYE